MCSRLRWLTFELHISYLWNISCRRPLCGKTARIWHLQFSLRSFRRYLRSVRHFSCIFLSCSNKGEDPTPLFSASIFQFVWLQYFLIIMRLTIMHWYSFGSWLVVKCFSLAVWYFCEIGMNNYSMQNTTHGTILEKLRRIRNEIRIWKRWFDCTKFHCTCEHNFCGNGPNL